MYVPSAFTGTIAGTRTIEGSRPYGGWRYFLVFVVAFFLPGHLGCAKDTTAMLTDRPLGPPPPARVFPVPFPFYGSPFICAFTAPSTVYQEPMPALPHQAPPKPVPSLEGCERGISTDDSLPGLAEEGRETAISTAGVEAHMTASPLFRTMGLCSRFMYHVHTFSGGM